MSFGPSTRFKRVGNYTTDRMIKELQELDELVMGLIDIGLGGEGNSTIRNLVSRRGLETLSGLKGDKGDPGEQGDQGEQGPQGESIQGPRGLRGLTGDPGLSAYQLAVAYGGYTGSLTQWLAEFDEAFSLAGVDADHGLIDTDYGLITVYHTHEIDLGGLTS